MTGMFRRAQVSLVVLAAVSFLSIDSAKAIQDEVGTPGSPPAERLALLNDAYAPAEPVPAKVSTKATANEPVPFSISTMASDMVPPFPAHPELTPVTSAPQEELSFEENMPVEPKADSIDDHCKEMTQMIAGNLESDISLEAKTMMIETAMKMIARNIELKAEAEIKVLKAEHALEIARMQSQMMQMRSLGNAADQINRVAGPLSQMLQRNYQQSVATNESTHRMSQTLAQIGHDKLEKEIQAARARRQKVFLSSPEPKPLPTTAERDYQWRLSRMTAENAWLREKLEQQRHTQPSTVVPASYNQPLQPRRQPLEPLHSCAGCAECQLGATKKDEWPLPFSVNNGGQYLQYGPELRLSREAAALKESRALNDGNR